MSSYPSASITSVGLQLAVPAVRTSTFTGAAVDVAAYEGPMLVSQDVGATSGTPTLAGKIQDPGGGPTDTQGGRPAAFSAVSTANNLQGLALQAGQVRKYIRYVGTISGGTPSLAFAVHAFGVKKMI